MSLTINTRAYTADLASNSNNQPYVGPANTITVKDRFELGRTYPKPTKTLSGVARARVKQVKTVTLTGALTVSGDLIANHEISVPVGTAAADVDTFCADQASWWANAAAKTLLKQLNLSN
jgi:hypothetical protein